jgi:molybdate transport system substrate-binding protein
MSPTPSIRTVAVLGSLVVLMAISGCGQREGLTVFAAASLTDAVTEAAMLFQQQESTPISLSFASSSILARQIEAGAEADVYLSANTRWMDFLEEQGIVDEEKRFNRLENRLVLVVPRGSGFRADLAPGAPVPSFLLRGRIAVGETGTVPAGIYARQALASLGWLEDLEPNFIPCDNVRSALMLVARREADAGIVYLTDPSDGEVEIAGILPKDSHEPIVYPAALIEGGRRERGQSFLRFLTGPEASAIFASYGFSTIESGERL